MNVIYALQQLPEARKSVFLAGPTPRSPEVPSWRPEALQALADMGYHDTVFVPEPESGDWATEYDNQVEWEEKALTAATCILFWIPRDLTTMPAFTTNVEFGAWCASGKVVLGYPQGAVKMRYLAYYAAKHKVPVLHSLRETVATAIGRVYQSVSLGEDEDEAGWINFMRVGKDIGTKKLRVVRVYDTELNKPMVRPWVLPALVSVLARRFADDPQFVEELSRLGLRLEVDG